MSQTLTITAAEGEEFDITEVKTDLADKVTHKLETVKKGKEYTLAVVNNAKKEGIVRGRVELKTTSMKKPSITIPVFVKIQSEVHIQPTSLYFGKIDTGGGTVSPDSLTKSVVLTNARGDALDVKKVKGSSNWIQTKTETNAKGSRYTVMITLDKNKMPKGKFDEKVEIKTNKKKEPLIVTIKGEVI